MFQISDKIENFRSATIRLVDGPQKRKFEVMVFFFLLVMDYCSAGISMVKFYSAIITDISYWLGWKSSSILVLF